MYYKTEIDYDDFYGYYLPICWRSLECARKRRLETETHNKYGGSMFLRINQHECFSIKLVEEFQ
jgi:hypothetical protein